MVSRIITGGRKAHPVIAVKSVNTMVNTPILLCQFNTFVCVGRTQNPHTRHTKSNENECYEVDYQLLHGPAKPTTMQQPHLSEERNLTIVVHSRLYLHLMELSVRGCSIVKIGTREHHQRVTPCGNVTQQISRIHLRKCHRLPALVGFELVKTHDTCSKDLSVFRLYHSSHLPIIST